MQFPMPPKNRSTLEKDRRLPFVTRRETPGKFCHDVQMSRMAHRSQDIGLCWLIRRCQHAVDFSLIDRGRNRRSSDRRGETLLLYQEDPPKQARPAERMERDWGRI